MQGQMSNAILKIAEKKQNEQQKVTYVRSVHIKRLLFVLTNFKNVCMPGDRPVSDLLLPGVSVTQTILSIATLLLP